MAIGVIAILASLALVAVNAARESSRRASCLGQLRQIGMSLQAYHDVHRQFPGLHYQARFGDSWSTYPISPLPALLPHLGEEALYARINFETSMFDYNVSTNLSGANETIKRTVVRSFLCPSDPVRFEMPANVNYAFSCGTYVFADSNGAFSFWRLISANQITDGLASTVGVGEISKGGSDPFRFDPRRDFWYSAANENYDPKWTADDIVDICRNRSPDMPFYSFRGFSWYNGGYENVNYNHTATPNSDVGDCSLNSQPKASSGSFASRSSHSGGVHAAAMDGSARWFSSGIEVAVWRALGTRSGGEMVSF